VDDGVPISSATLHASWRSRCCLPKGSERLLTPVAANGAAMTSRRHEQRLRNDAQPCPEDRGRLEDYIVKSKRDKELRRWRTVTINSNDVAANRDKMMYHHVLEVLLDERSLLVRGICGMITEGNRILRWTGVWGWSWHGLYGIYKAPMENVLELKWWRKTRDTRCSPRIPLVWPEEGDRVTYANGWHSGRRFDLGRLRQ
jgi:hypothetical protein